MATRPKAVIESRNGEKFSPITIAKNVLTDDGQNLHDILSDRKEDMMTPTIENSSPMFKVGQGDNVDYSENVVDGAYENCVLKGVTKFVDNNTGETLDSFVENRDLSLIDCKSPILSNVGKNLYNPDTAHVVGINNQDISNIIDVKPNTTYTFYANGYGWTQVAIYDKTGQITRQIGQSSTSKRVTFTTTTNETRARLGFFHGNNTLIENVDFTGIQLEQDTQTTAYEPYKSNILSCNGDKIELTEDMFEQGTTAQYSANIGKTYQWMKENSTQDYNIRRLRTKSLIKIEPNTKLILQNTDNFMYAMGGYGVDKLSLGTFDTSWVQNTTITIPQDVYYISFAIRKKDDTSITIDDFKNTNFTLSEVDKTIVLRSLPGDVCDTLNVETGEYTRKIGEIIIDGSENWKLSTRFSSTYNSYYFVLNEAYKNKMKCISDKYQILLGGEDLGKNIGLHMGSSDNNIAPFISSDKMTLSEFKEYLQQNPVTVQYELATPIVSTVDIQGFPFSYKNGHVQLSSGSIEQSLTPKVEYSVVTNRNGQIRSNQKMVERHQKQLDRLQAMILTNLVNTQYEQALTNLKYDLKNVREEVK